MLVSLNPVLDHAGMAAFIGRTLSVNRVVQFSGADDFVGVWPATGVLRAAGQLSTPSPWLMMDSTWQTPPERMYGFGDLHGRCCPSWEPAWRALRLPGAGVQVDGKASFGDAHKLCSNIDMHAMDASNKSDHMASVADCCTPLAADGVTPLFLPVWRHLLLHNDSAAGHTRADAARSSMEADDAVGADDDQCSRCGSFP